jgi:hypothetical protein
MGHHPSPSMVLLGDRWILTFVQLAVTERLHVCEDHDNHFRPDLHHYLCLTNHLTKIFPGLVRKQFADFLSQLAISPVHLMMMG